MKKIISYIWPFTRTVKSTINGTLEITLMNGKKVLDSENANYSYGLLQKVLAFGLSKTGNIDPTADILLLGMGAGCVLESIKKMLVHTGKITAVEIDPTVIEIAKSEFAIERFAPLEIVQSDALAFVNNCPKQFDLIIVDLFIDEKVPERFYSTDFWNKVSALLKLKGNVIFNAGISMKNDDRIEKIVDCLQGQVIFTKYENVTGLNTLLIGERVRK